MGEDGQKTVKQLHRKAMDLAFKAEIASIDNDNDEAARLYFEAFRHEVEAAGLVPESEQAEPTRSVLCRSAAMLAYRWAVLSGEGLKDEEEE